ncbi:MAG: riboflavin synthase [Patescibacteria group bacterium]
MFTGIIEATARVIENTSGSLTLERPKHFTDLKKGSSVSVAGVCLTVVKLTKENMAFDVVPETLKRTTMGTLNVGDRVNLERALRVGDRFEGHIVQGHVDGVGIVRRSTKSTKSTRSSKSSRHTVLEISYLPHLKNLLVEKGSVAVDGVSLTIASLNDVTFSVALIPHTLAETTLGELKEGDTVNLEADILGKYRTNSR